MRECPGVSVARQHECDDIEHCPGCDTLVDLRRVEAENAQLRAERDQAVANADANHVLYREQRQENTQLRATLAEVEKAYRYLEAAEAARITQVDQLRKDKLELIEQHAPAWLARLEREGTGIDRSAHVTEFTTAQEGVAYILRAYHETHAKQKQELRQLRATLTRVARCQVICECDALAEVRRALGEPNA